MNWGNYFRLKKIGFSTWFYIRLDTKEPISPDFRDKGEARAWMKKNFTEIVFEMTVLGK